jgi:hypothetical protein
MDKFSFFRSEKFYKPNTFIGGIAFAITKRSDLALALNVSTKDIKSLRRIDNNYEFYINRDYTPNFGYYFESNGQLRDRHGNSEITYFKDLGGNIKSLGDRDFQACINLEEVEFPGLTSIDGPQNGTSGLFQDCINLLICKIPLINSLVGESHFKNTPKLEVLEMPLLTGAIGNGKGMFTNCGVLSLDLPLVTSIEGEAFNRSALTSFNVPLLATGGSRSFLGFQDLEEFILPSLTTITNKKSNFRRCNSAVLIQAKKLKVFGDPSLVGTSSNREFAFDGLKLNCLIQINIDLFTANDGEPDAALIYAKNNRNATVEFYDDNDNLVTTL